MIRKYLLNINYLRLIMRANIPGRYVLLNFMIIIKLQYDFCLKFRTEVLSLTLLVRLMSSSVLLLSQIFERHAWTMYPVIKAFVIELSVIVILSSVPGLGSTDINEVEMGQVISKQYKKRIINQD